MAKDRNGTLSLTTKQAKVLRFLAEYRAEHGIAPRLADVAEGVGISKVTAHEHLDALREAGAITKEPYRSRSITITDAGRRCLPSDGLSRLRWAWKVATEGERRKFMDEAAG